MPISLAMGAAWVSSWVGVCTYVLPRCVMWCGWVVSGGK